MKKYKAKYFYMTVEINTLIYISGYQLSEDGFYSNPPIEPLADENGKLRWVIDSENPLRIYEVIQSLTAEEEDAKQKKKKREEINRLFTHEDELRLMNSAILALSEGKQLPDEYKEYRKIVDEINARKLEQKEQSNGNTRNAKNNP